MKPKNKKEDKINNININNKEKNNKNKVITKYNSKKSYDMKDDIKNKNKKNEINKNKSQSSFLRRKAYNIKFIPSKKSNSKKKRYSTNFYIDLQKINNEVNKESYKKNIYTVNLNDTLNNNLNENNNNNKSIISNNNSNNNLNNSYFKLYTNRSANTSSKNWRAKTPNKNNYNNKENKTLSIDKKLDKNYFDKILENNKKRENYIKNYKFNEYKDIRLLENIFLKNNNNQNNNNNNNNLYNIIKIKYSEINKNKSAPALKKIKKENPIKLTNLKINHKFNNQYLNNDNQIINNNNKVDKDYSYDALINKIKLNNSNENITNTAKELIENKNKLLNDIITKAGIEIKI